MASLNITINEVWKILKENDWLTKYVKEIKPEQNGLVITISKLMVRTDVRVKQESFSNGVLKLNMEAEGKLSGSIINFVIDIVKSNKDFNFISREGDNLSIDLNNALKGKIKGIQVNKFELRDGLVKIEF
jgi:hypothetical protein